MNPIDPNAEWLEADGLGGFASGTVSGIRSRRYHALLLTATTPPARRMVLVNGFDAWVETSRGIFAISSQRYGPDIIHSDGASRIESFQYEPWPCWRYKIDDDIVIEQELFVPKGESAIFMSWKVVAGNDRDVKLRVRPFLSGRDFHSTHHENGSFKFEAEQSGERVMFRSYDGVPAVVACSNGRYTHEPTWYRNFFYSEEQARGLDAVEDLASPGIFEFSLSQKPAVLMIAAEGRAVRDIESIEARRSQIRAIEQARREYFSSPLERAADAYLVQRGKGKPLLPVTRGSEIGDATRLSRCAGSASQPLISRKHATSCCNGRERFQKACCRIAFLIRANNRSLILLMRRFGTSSR